MVRRCVVKNCKSTDLNTLCHRFPRNPKLTQLWMNNLGINECSVKYIYEKYVVCTLHFEVNDYRNPITNYLNTNAVPKLTDAERPIREDSPTTGNENWCLMVKQVNELYKGSISCTKVEMVDAKSRMTPENKHDFADEYDFTDEEGLKSDTFETVTMILDNNDSDEYDSKNEITMSNSISDIEFLDVEENDDNIIENDTESNEEFIEYSDYYENSGDQIDFSVKACNEYNDSSSIKLEADPYIQYEDAACQVDSDELERNNSNDDTYCNLTREDLIKELNRSQSQISSLTTQLENIQYTHSKLLQNMEALKYLIGP